MNRNLDIAALRSFVMVAEQKSVTRAAGFLNLTQSAVSMQIKRLEDALDLRLFDRHNRTLSLTSVGDQLLSHARRMITLNDEAVLALTSDAFEGTINLGVPHDIVYPAIPGVLRAFSKLYPRVQINLISSFTKALHQNFAAGECDIILGTEQDLLAGGETIVELPLVFVGAKDGDAWKERPLPLAFERNCIFRGSVQNALDAAGIDWVQRVDTAQARTIEATVGADLAVHAMIDQTVYSSLEVVDDNGTLPVLGVQLVNLYAPPSGPTPTQAALIQMLKEAYGALG